jgi:hypothetical protein
MRTIIRENIYGAKIFLLVCDEKDFQKTRNTLDKEFGHYDMVCCNGLSGCSTRNRYYILMLRNLCNIDVLGHECFHVTHRIMELVGVRITPDNHEPHACLYSWLLDRCYRQLRKWRVWKP